MKNINDILIILLILFSTASAINQNVKIQVRRVGSARVTPRPMRRQEWIQ